MAVVCFKFLVSGRVQGVWYRDSTRRQAEQLGISGSAVNLPDGRVEVIACGESGAVDQLASWLHQGPPAAKVTSVSSESIAIKPPGGFSIG